MSAIEYQQEQIFPEVTRTVTLTETLTILGAECECKSGKQVYKYPDGTVNVSYFFKYTHPSGKTCTAYSHSPETARALGIPGQKENKNV